MSTNDNNTTTASLYMGSYGFIPSLPYSFDQDEVIGDPICNYVWRRGVRFPYTLTPVARQPYVVQFFISGPFVDIVNVLSNIALTIRGRIENIINVPKNPRSVGEVISWMTKSFRDVAGIIDEVNWYRQAIKQRQFIFYVDIEVLPLGFYLATAPPLTPSEYDVAASAIVLHKILYNKTLPELSRINKKQKDDDYSYLYKVGEGEKTQKDLSQRAIEYAKKVFKIDEFANLIKKETEKVQQIIDYQDVDLPGLSFYDSVIFYWYENAGLDLRLLPVRKALADGKILIYSHGQDWQPGRNDIRHFYDTYIDIAGMVPLVPYDETVSKLTYRRHAKAEFLGVSVNVESKTTKQMVNAIATSIINRKKDTAFSALNIYQTYGLKFVPLLPFSVNYSSSNQASFLTDYGRYRLTLDRYINEILKNRAAKNLARNSEVQAAIKELTAGLGSVTSMTATAASKFAKKLPVTQDQNDDISQTEEAVLNEEDLESIFKDDEESPEIQNDDFFSGFAGADPAQSYYNSGGDVEDEEDVIIPGTGPIVDAEIYKEQIIKPVNNSARFEPGAVIRWKSEIPKNIHSDYAALYSLSKIKRFGDPKQEIPFTYQEYAEMLRKIFLPSRDNSFELATFIKTLGDNEQLATLRSAHYGDEAAVFANYKLLSPNAQDGEEMSGDVKKIIDKMAETTVNRMSVIRNIIDESVFKLIKYYDLLMGLSGIDVSAPMHYMASLEPFTDFLPDLPIVTKVFFNDLDRAMARVLGSEVAAINMQLQSDQENRCYRNYFSIYRDFLPLRSLTLKYDDIETTNVEFFGHSFSIPSNWNSLRPAVRISVIDFYGQVFSRYWQKYRKLVFRNNGSWPILSMAFILDILGLDKSFNVTDLISLVVLPKSITMTEIDYDSSSQLTEAGAVDIDFEVIGFVDYVDLITLAGPLIVGTNALESVIETVNANRITTRFNPFSEWYHMHNYNPLPAKYARYTPNTNANATAVSTIKKIIADNTPARQAHLVEKNNPNSPNGKKILIYEPQYFGRTISTKAFKPKQEA